MALGLDYRWLAGLALVAYVLGKLITYIRSPLRRFPGPFLAAVSELPNSYHMMAGDHPKWVASLHEKYGSVVRIAPNELCFITPSSYGDIYGHRKGHAVFCKSAGYDAAAFVAQTRSIVNERDPREHARMRRLVSPAFSERALRQQHPYVAKTADVLMEELGKRLGQPLDLGMWFALCTFDIVTNLSLGESLEALRAGKRHPWAVFFMNGARAMSDGIILIRSKLLSSLVKAFPPPQVTAMVKELRSHEEFTTAMVRKRQENPVDRDDIIGRILANQHVAEEEGGGEKYSTAYIAAQMSDFVIAGTDTTSVALSTATYYCLKNPTVIAKLKAEIRGRFARYEDITAASTTDLPYLNAVLSESMRIMPPVSWAASRVVPAGGDTVDGYFLPAGTWVTTHTFSASRSADNFKDPLEFQPERWIDHNGYDKLEASQPFSIGTRQCLGKQLAWTEMRLIMCKLHFKFDISHVNTEVDWVRDSKFYLLWSKPPLMVRITERTD